MEDKDMINEFIRGLEASPGGSVFNPWWQRDEENDAVGNAPEIRRNQLQTYLTERVQRAKYLLVAEALGYQGGHFSGIPMTSERILLGHSAEVTPDQVIQSNPMRTSKETLKAKGFSEPTATIVWGHIISQAINTRDVFLWNAFPWHPYDPESGLLSNRTPSEDEMTRGVEILKNLIHLVRPKQIFAIGKKAEELLVGLNIKAFPLRHPANGGAGKFRRQFTEYLTKVK
jgi:Uracil DNA glycosylase superfamily